MADNSSSGLMKWTIVGTVLQLIMVISGHYNEFIAQNVFAIGGMSISLIVGAAYGATAARSRGNAAGGGMLVGGGCALIGITVSVALGDVPALILLVGTVSSAVTGAIGGFAAAFFSPKAAATTGA